MAVDYTTFFDIAKLYCSPYRKMANHSADIDSSISDAVNKIDIIGTDDYSDELADILDEHHETQTSDTSFQADYKRLQSNFLQGDGKNIIQSSETVADDIAADLVTYMTRDSESVLTNTIGNSISYSRAGDGTVSTFTQNQITRNDTITLTCTTAQTVSVDEVFSVRSDFHGELTATVTADGSTSYDDDDLGATLGISALTVAGGTPSNYWAVADQIIITTTSDDRSILLSAFRDMYDEQLPTNASPTISNTMDDVDSSFPGSPVDGQRVVIDGVRYWYSEDDSGWVQECSGEII